MTAPSCPYCGKVSDLVTGKTIYPNRFDLHKKQFYNCAPCGAYVGCHSGTTKPLGRLANAELRKAKQAAHSAFDPLWQRKIIKDNMCKSKARSLGYKWLSEQLNIAFEDCHIGMFNVEQCNRVVDICNTIGVYQNDKSKIL